MLEVPLPIADVLAGIHGAVEELSYEIGLMLVLAVIESECERIAGLKDSKNPLRTANWWGSQPGSIYFGKQKVLINRPRLRGKDNKEIQLSTYNAFQNPKGMNSEVKKQLILGISSRNYEEAVAALLRAEKRFKRVKGYREIPKLVAPLQHPKIEIEILKIIKLLLVKCFKVIYNITQKVKTNKPKGGKTMIKQTQLKFKLGITEDEITSRAGLAVYAEFLRGFGIKDLIDRHMPLPGSNRGYKAWQYWDKYHIYFQMRKICMTFT